MKQFCITVLFLLVEICSVTAQDLIVMRDGNIIEARVMEISSTEIKYKRFEHLDGPTIVIPAANILSIRYENGTSEIITAISSTRRQPTQAIRSEDTAIDPNKFIFGINANAGGAIGYALGKSGAGLNIELGKGRFNGEINLMFPFGGFAALFTFNGFWPSRIGGAYLGGGIGFSFFESYYYDVHWNGTSLVDDSYYYIASSLTIGLNAGYKFVTRSGLYFRTGAFVGFDFGWIWGHSWFPLFIKPDLAIGWTMK